MSLFLRALALVCLPRTARGCNGDGGFCELSLGNFTFPGTHNSGAFGLTMPLKYTPLAGCWYNNHNADYEDQLRSGIRYFNIDLCTLASNPSEAINCHAPSKDEDSMALGEPFLISLQRIKRWLEFSPNELLFFDPGNLRTHSSVHGPRIWRDSFTTVFGSCTNNPEETESTQLGCLWVSRFPQPNLTLGSLVRAGRRVLVLTAKFFVMDTWNKGYSGMEVSELSSYITDVAQKAEANEAKLLIFSIFRSQSFPDPEDIKSCDGVFDCIETAWNQLGEVQLSCNSMMAEDTAALLPGDDADADLDSPVVRCGESSCGCAKYRSQLELDHQVLLDKGRNIFTVMVDYSVEWGHAVALAHRMNQASLRRLKGELEPKPSWLGCNWVILLVIGLMLVLMLIVALALVAHRRGWCARKYVRPKQARLAQPPRPPPLGQLKQQQQRQQQQQQQHWEQQQGQGQQRQQWPQQQQWSQQQQPAVQLGGLPPPQWQVQQWQTQQPPLYPQQQGLQPELPPPQWHYYPGGAGWAPLPSRPQVYGVQVSALGKVDKE